MCKVISAQDFYQSYRNDSVKSSQTGDQRVMTEVKKIDPSVYWMV